MVHTFEFGLVWVGFGSNWVWSGLAVDTLVVQAFGFALVWVGFEPHWVWFGFVVAP